MSISFNDIPTTNLTPGVYIEFDNSKAVGLLKAIHRVLVIGQRLTTGTIAEGVPTRITSATQAKEYFGEGSMLASMLATYFDNNDQHETWAIALDDNGAGVAATGDLTVSGTTTASGTLNLYIAGQRVQVGVTAGQSLSTVASNIVAAVTADASLPVTAAVNGGTPEQVDFTAKHKGVLGNNIDLRLNYQSGEALPTGLGIAINAMSGGTANPDITTAITAMADVQYHSVIQPYTDASNLSALHSELDDRFGPMVMQEGSVYTAAIGSVAEQGTLGDSLNSQHISIMGAGKSPTAPWNWAAAFGGIVSYHGDIDPARPFQTLVMAGVLPPAESDRFTRTERNQTLADGIATFTVSANGECMIERAVTTYKTNASGAPDPSYRDVNTLLTLFFLRFSLRARISQKFPRYKLAKDGTRYGDGQDTVTPSVARSEIIALFKQWETIGLVEDIKQFKKDLIVKINDADPNRLDVRISPNVVNQLRVFAGQVQFKL
ncbi:MAG: phage tail sheath subtilisin-like domain-containing protein [Alphaproteobacteria bacterium]|nr:phage tail sheath subtilisin-like domain-containing protein [Alphaproteobacteria bacterium]MDD9919779.1 phage tail sheath subtilisin-like domain-containing protein [Alphaproteobacteria bacterium]